MSRAKMVKLIESGSVSVAFKPIANPAHQLQAGQEIAVRDFGRLSLNDISLTSKNK